MAIRWIDGYL